MIIHTLGDRLSNRDYNMLSRAQTIAMQGSTRHRHGAIITKGGSVLSVGVNARRNEHPTMEMPKDLYTEHAELAALRGLGRPMVFYAKGCTVYVVRINRRGSLVYSAPCDNCMTQLELWQVKRVVHS